VHICAQSGSTQTGSNLAFTPPAPRPAVCQLPRRAGQAPGAPPRAPGGRGPAVLWFRGDLRVADHDALAAANEAGTSLLPVYCFDPREYGQVGGWARRTRQLRPASSGDQTHPQYTHTRTHARAQSPGGFDRTGVYRASFILSALADLRAALRDRGSDLVVRIGRPEEVLPQVRARDSALALAQPVLACASCRRGSRPPAPHHRHCHTNPQPTRQLAARVGATRVFCSLEVTAEERRVEAAVGRALDGEGAALQALWGGTLFHPDDLPFSLDAMPLSYGEFRERVAGVKKWRGGGGAARGGAGCVVRQPLAAPDSLKGLPAAW
jgi:deoxyribodipyrimidine photo-lyase